MKTKNSVFIATSLDGYIADHHGSIDWLYSVPNPDQIDMGYNKFISRVDALIMGRNTFETVLGFEMEWPYQKPVFVLSKSLSKIPEVLADKVFLIRGSLQEIISKLHGKGYFRLYIDGGKAIQSFLEEDLIDELIITTIPILLGGGTPLFTSLTERLQFRCTKTELLLEQLVQSQFIRQRSD